MDVYPFFASKKGTGTFYRPIYQSAIVAIIQFVLGGATGERHSGTTLIKGSAATEAASRRKSA